jgi:predicted lipoprotein
MTRPAGLLAVPIVMMLTACLPWTVVPLEDDETAAWSGGFDAAAYVDSVWESRLLPLVRESAIEFPFDPDPPGEASPSHRFVTAEGGVLHIDAVGRTARAAVDVHPGDGGPDLYLAVGPLIPGSALRDASGFMEFSRFANQLDHADVAIALNRRVVAEVLGTIEVEELPGRTVRFWGVWTPLAEGGGEVVPVALEVR